MSNQDGVRALAVSVRYLTIMVLSFPILHILHVFRNVLQALGIAIWSLMSGFAELAARILMSKFVIGYIGADALFLSEPASWLGAMICVFCPIFTIEKTAPLSFLLFVQLVIIKLILLRRVSWQERSIQKIQPEPWHLTCG